MAEFPVVYDGTEVCVSIPQMLVVSNRQELKSVVRKEFEKGHNIFVLDFGKTPCAYVDPSGLGVLVSLSKWAKEVGSEVHFQGFNEDLRTLLELTKLDTLFSIRETQKT